MNQDENFLAISNQLQLFDQKELNNLIRNLNLSKEFPEILASLLKDTNLLDKDTNVTLYRKRNAKLIPLFNQTLELVHCSYIKRVLLILDVNKYDRNSCRLFIENSQHT